ncbi:MAG: glycosyltransferase family 4 protein [Gemmatimonadetes bacterium]|nr:glycosyltransferase family 4 protein [Gemmatimonadota bacterium]
MAASANGTKVVHVVPALFRADGGVLGGAERYVLELARYMAREVPTELVTFGPRASRERVEELDITVLGSPWHVGGQPSNPVSLGMFTPLRRATTVHCHQQHVLASSMAAVFCRITRRHVFVTDLGGGGWDVSAYMSTDRWFHAHLHISEYSRTVLGQSGQPWSHVISGGVDTERFSPGPRRAVDGPVVYVGRLVPHKGVDYLIEGLPADMPLEIIGQPYDPTFAARLRTLATGKRVTFRHDCSDEDLVAAYRSALCVVVPSVYRTAAGHETRVPELLGQTALEAMACGVPVVSTNVASLPEVVDDEVTGFCVPPNEPRALGDRLTWLAGHPEQARTMGAAARDRVLERFTWPATVRRCLDIYAQFDPNMAGPV